MREALHTNEPKAFVRFRSGGAARDRFKRVRLRKAALAVGIGVIFAAAALNVGKGFYWATLYSQDFQWSPAVLLSEGRDPYAWFLDGNAGERIMMSQEPNYLHLLYVLLLPFTYLPWAAAKAAWAVCNVAAGALSIHLVARANGLRGAAYLFAVGTFLAAGPFSHALGGGQQSLFVLLALAAAWTWRNSAAGGFWLAVGVVKYSFLPPLGLWLLMERRIMTLAIAALITVLALCLFAALSGADLVIATFEPLRVSAQATHVGIGDAMSFARVLGADQQFGAVAPYILGLCCASAGVSVVWRCRSTLDDAVIFALLNIVSLFSLFHQVYDYVLLLPLFCCALTFPPTLRASSLAYVGYIWFVFYYIDGPWMKSPAVIGATALASAAIFTLILRHRAHAAPPCSAPNPIAIV